MENEAGQPLVYTVEQAGKLLGLSRPTSYKYANDGTLPAVRVGHRLVVPRSRLLAMLAGTEQPKS